MDEPIIEVAFFSSTDLRADETEPCLARFVRLRSASDTTVVIPLGYGKAP